MIEVRVVKCECGCDDIVLSVFLDGKPVEFSDEIIDGYLGGDEALAAPFRRWLDQYDSLLPGYVCPECLNEFPVTDESEQTSLADHGRCVACQKEWQWEQKIDPEE